jgi:transcriptional regulator with XRE-family HTH domain
MDIREVFAPNLRKRRHAAKLSHEELAHRAEIDRTYISALERSVYAASIDVVDRLATVIGIQASDLLVPGLRLHATRTPTQPATSRRVPRLAQTLKPEKRVR